MILELAFFMYILNSLVMSFPQNPGYVNSQYGEPNSPSLADLEAIDNVLADARVHACEDSLNREGAVDSSSNSQYSKKSSTPIDDFDLTRNLENDDDLITTPLAVDSDGKQYAGKLIPLSISSYTEDGPPECAEGKSAFCCSFKKPDPYKHEVVFENYDCLTPAELRRLGKTCDDEGEKRPNQLPWNKRWDCCVMRILEKHQIGDEWRKTWIGMHCEKANTKSPGHYNGVNKLHQNFCPQSVQPGKALKLQSQSRDPSSPVAAESTDEENNLE